MTHLRFDARLPLARAITTYQKHRSSGYAASRPETAGKSQSEYQVLPATLAVEPAFKCLKSRIGLKGPPNDDPRTAKVFILVHLLLILLLEPLIDAFEDSPH